MLAVHNCAPDLVFQYQMSYPYQSPYNLDSSNPGSPWSLDQPHQDQHQHQQQQQQTSTPSFHADTPSNLSHSSVAASPAYTMQHLSPVASPLQIVQEYGADPAPVQSFDPPRQIQLEERSSGGNVHVRFEHIDSSVIMARVQEQAAAQEAAPRRRAAPKASARGGADEMSASTRPSSGGAGPSRVPHGRAAHTHAHPYRRPSAAAASPPGSSPGKRVSPGPAAPGPPPVRARDAVATSAARPHPGAPDHDELLAERSARPSRGVPVLSLAPAARAAVPCPGMSMWRVPSQSDQREQEAVGGDAGAATTSTGEPSSAAAQSDPKQEAQAPIAQAPTRRLLITTDLYLDVETNVVVAYLELPGLKRDAVRIDMITCPYTGCRQLRVRAQSRAMVHSKPYAVRERKAGECMRIIAVPLSTKPEDVTAKIEDGLLTITFPGGTPVREDPQEINIL